MNKYELAVVVSAKIEDEERAQVVEKCKALVERFGGTITEVDEWGKRRLAYPINDLEEGYYVLMTFSADSAFPAELDRLMRINVNVMRSIIVSKDA